MTKDTPFKPCPICGHRLTTKDIVFIDDCGEPIAELNDLRNYEDIFDPSNSTIGEHEEFVGSIFLVTIDCRCGYSFGHYPTMNDIYDGTWFKKFVTLANTRAEDIDKGKAVVMNDDNPYGRVLSKFYEELHEERPSLTMIDVIRAGLMYWQKEIKEWSE